jgi:hypothetical protein
MEDGIQGQSSQVKISFANTELRKCRAALTCCVNTKLLPTVRGFSVDVNLLYALTSGDRDQSQRMEKGVDSCQRARV